MAFLISNSVQIAILSGLVSIIYGLFLTVKILMQPRGDKEMNQIADAIAEGASAYMKRQYNVIGLIGLFVFAVLYFVFSPLTAIGFATGAICSAIAGVIGMSVAVRSNIRTAQAAKKGLDA
ncbi:sodium-translocating pyrophosphatase, partial [Candidatus Roizmanbacteria bacterium CG09_land_8_20_14_0_10_41_9]